MWLRTRDEVMVDVREFEPPLALLGGRTDSMYRRFLRDLPNIFPETDTCFCEIGACGQAEKMKDLFISCGLWAEVKRDLAGKERVIIGSWKNLS